jgi:ornithine carbamoyltransferase
MANNLRGRSLLTLEDYTKEEIELLLTTAKDYKAMKQAGIPHATLKGKSIALLFEKASTRTRAAFEVAAADLGMHSSYLGQGETQFGKKESTEDTAKVLGRFYDGIEFRGFSHQTVEELAKFSGVPVWNGLTDFFHPTQVLADFMTIQENFHRPLSHIKMVYIGDGRNNTANSLMIGAAKVGMHFTICSPEDLRPTEGLTHKAHEFAKESGAQIHFSNNPHEAVDGADVIYTDVWASMGEEDQLGERVEKLRHYQVNQSIIDATHNADVIFLHCLPAIHDTNTALGATVHDQYGLDAMEVTDDVFRGLRSKVFDLAENRMHTIKAVMVSTLGA